MGKSRIKRAKVKKKTISDNLFLTILDMKVNISLFRRFFYAHENAMKLNKKLYCIFNK